MPKRIPTPYHAFQCRQRVRNGNPRKPKFILVERDDTIVVVISQANLVANVKE